MKNKIPITSIKLDVCPLRDAGVLGPRGNVFSSSVQTNDLSKQTNNLFSQNLNWYLDFGRLRDPLFSGKISCAVLCCLKFAFFLFFLEKSSFCTDDKNTLPRAPKTRPSRRGQQSSFILVIGISFFTFWPPKFRASVSSLPSLSYLPTPTHLKDCTGLGEPNTLKLLL